MFFHFDFSAGTLPYTFKLPCVSLIFLIFSWSLFNSFLHFFLVFKMFLFFIFYFSWDIIVYIYSIFLLVYFSFQLYGIYPVYILTWFQECKANCFHILFAFNRILSRVLSQEYERKFPNFSHLHDVHHLAFLKCHGTKAFQYSLRSVCYEFFHAFEHNRNCWRLYHIFFAFKGVLYSMNSSLYLEWTETTESSPTFLTFIGLLSIMNDLMVLNRTGTIEGFKAFL